jgi:hypothetical protein
LTGGDRRWLLLLIVASVGSAGMLAWLYGAGSLPLLVDSQGHFFIVERAASGVPPHVSSVSMKHSLAFMTYGAAIWLGRLARIADVWAARLLGVAFLSGSFALAGWLAWSLTARKTAAVFAILAMASLGGFTYMAMVGARPKIALVFVMLATAALVARDRLFLAGVGAGAAFLCWQPAGLLFAGNVAIAVSGEARWKRLGRSIAGVLVAVAGYEAYYVWHGALREQILQSYWMPVRFVPGSWRSPPHLLARLRRIWCVGFHRSNPSGVLLMAALAAAAAAAVRHRSRLGAWVSENRLLAYLAITTCAAVAFTVYDQQSYPDLFILVPALSVLSGASIARASRWLGRKTTALPSAVFQLGMAFWLAWLAVTAPRRFEAPYTLHEQVELAEAVSTLPPGTEVYTVFCNHLLAFLHRDNWSPVSNLFRGVHDFVAARGGPIELPYEDGALPSVILVGRQKLLFPEIREVLEREYERVGAPRFATQGIAVWVRRDEWSRLSAWIEDRREQPRAAIRPKDAEGLCNGPSGSRGEVEAHGRQAIPESEQQADGPDHRNEARDAARDALAHQRVADCGRQKPHRQSRRGRERRQRDRRLHAVGDARE